MDASNPNLNQFCSARGVQRGRNLKPAGYRSVTACASTIRMSNSLRDLIDDRADLDDEEEDGSFAGEEDGDDREPRPRARRPELDDSSEEDEDDEDEEEAAKVSQINGQTTQHLSQ